MGKIIENIKKNLKTYSIALIISLLVGVAVFLIFFFVQNQTIAASLNGTGIAFAILFGGATLILLQTLGAFDTFSFGFKQVASSMFGKDANKYNDYAQYKEDKRSVRSNAPKTYIAVYLASLLFLIAFIFLEIYKANLY